jgi:biotin transport system permease protein
MKQSVPWSYRPGNSPLHRAPAAVKLLGLFIITTAGLVFPFSGAAAGAVLILLGAAAARVKPWELLRGSKSLFIMILAVVLLRAVKLPPAIDMAGLAAALNFGLTLIVSFSAGSLVFSVTTMPEFKTGLEPVLGARFSLALSLMLMFMPRFFEAWEESQNAWKARGGKPGPRSLFTLLPLVASRMIELAGETAIALESRGARF